MQKTVCDICEEPVESPNKGFEFVFKDKLLIDDNAKIEMRLNMNFVKHSKGFGGPPELCSACLANLFKKFGDEFVSKLQNAE